MRLRLPPPHYARARSSELWHVIRHVGPGYQECATLCGRILSDPQTRRAMPEIDERLCARCNLRDQATQEPEGDHDAPRP